MSTAAPDWFATIDGTWPAAAYHRLGPWTLREGRGGGSRVSAATCDVPVSAADIAAAEAAMGKMGQGAELSHPMKLSSLLWTFLV